MSGIRGFLRREPTLVIAALAALVSCFLVPPDRGYLGYVDFRTLALLYCLMCVVAGLRQAGLFDAMAKTICGLAGGTRSLGILLVLLCFFTSMLITNDVALLTFVPFAVVVLGMAGKKQALLPVVVLQTVAANLGSMLTPVGNPQNLYLYSHYDMELGAFLRVTFPIWALSLGLILCCGFLIPKGALEPGAREITSLQKGRLGLYLGLFALCLLTVLRILDWHIMLALVVLALLFLDRPGLARADGWLLLTFVAFFVFAGNLARVEAVDVLLRRLLAGREYLAGLLTSQVISNVPAALLLSGFTSESRPLILGVNVGGLGTPIASLASLISLKLYARSDGASMGRYLALFTLVNVALLALLSLAAGILS